MRVVCVGIAVILFGEQIVSCPLCNSILFTAGRGNSNSGAGLVQLGLKLSSQDIFAVKTALSMPEGDAGVDCRF